MEPPSRIRRTCGVIVSLTRRFWFNQPYARLKTKGIKLKKKKFTGQISENYNLGRPTKCLLFMLALLWIAVSGTVLYSQTRTETVTLNTIMGVFQPETGRTPSKVITENTQYSGTVTWSPEVVGTFAPATQYTATITLNPKAGNTLQGVPANFFTVAGAVSVRNSAGSGVVTAVFPATIGTVINIPAIQGITVPGVGGTPVTAITESAQYRGTVTWSPAVTETFEVNTHYTATITLTPKTGYSLEGVAANFFTVAGATSVRNSAGSGVITAVFPATMSVNIAAIHGVTPPETGKSPVKTIPETAQYQGTITWSPAVTGAFEANTQYTAIITLTPKAGYTLQGIKDNFFTVHGAETVSNSANTGVVTVEFPHTKELKAVHSEDKRLWSIGASVGSAYPAPLFVGVVHGTIAPFNNIFIDVGADAGYGIKHDDVEKYYSVYPFVNLAFFMPFARLSGGKGGGFYGGAGGGVMLANYTFKNTPSIMDTTFAANVVVGVNLFDMIDISLTARSNIKSVNFKLAAGYVYRFK